jgi:hypothetical protein
VPPRATTEALLRLRRVDQREAMRALERARQAVDRATEARERAMASRATLAQRKEELRATPDRVTAGALVNREAYRAQLRAELEAADERVRARQHELRDAVHELTQAQKQVEQALRAREAAQKQRAAEDKALARRRERRDQAATDDRWRPPRR